MGASSVTISGVYDLAQAKVAELTLDEKIVYLCANHPAIERLGYPAYRLEAEGAHGLLIRDGNSFLSQTFPTTTFPETFGLSMTWDRELLRRIGSVISDEARAFNTLVIFSPTIDLARDPRWGRNEEAYGEDPYLAGQLSLEYLKGLQGDNYPYLKTAATVKHFYANNYEFERDWDDSVVPEQLKRDYYLRPFETAIVEGRSASMMTGYNMINGVIGMMNPEMNTILRDEWNADGYFVSDGKAPEILNEMYGVIGSGDEIESLARYLAMSLEAGMDCFLAYEDSEVIAAIKRGMELGLVTVEMIDRALIHQFSVMLRLGLIPGLTDNPYLTENINNERGIPFTTSLTPCHSGASAAGAQNAKSRERCNELNWIGNDSSALVRRAANEAVVLLKNDGLLPLNANATKKIAVIGQLGNENMRDWYSGLPPYQITPLDGIRNAFPNSEVVFDDGCDVVGIYHELTEKWLRVTDSGGVMFDGDLLSRAMFRVLDWGYGFAFQDVATGKYLTTTDSGEIRADATEVWGWFNRPVFFLNKPNAYSQVWIPPNTGSPLPVEESQSNISKPRESRISPAAPPVETRGQYPTGVTGIPITDDEDIDNARFSPMIPFGVPAKPFGAKREGKNQYLVLFDKGGVEKLNRTLSCLSVKVLDDGLKRAADTAAEADAAIVLMGNHSLIGARECVDRPSLALPQRWEALFESVAEANPNVILNLIAGYQYAIGAQEEKAKAVLFTTHGLQELGTAIGQTLNGVNNPSGKLSQTWYADDFQFSSLSNYDITDSKLTYLYTDKRPLHEFGFGLSYTTFEYSDLSLTQIDNGVEVSFRLTNTGERPGTEVVQVYVTHNRDNAPIKFLVAFDRITLEPGESKEAKIPVRHRELSFWDGAQNKFTMTPGTYQFQVGSSSADIRLKAEINLE